MNETDATLECGHNATQSTSSAGYATDKSGARMCYGCADSLQANEVAKSSPNDRFFGYLSMDGKTIQTWSGGVLMTRVWLGEFHHKSYSRRYISAVDIDGRVWSGTGAPGEYAPLKLTTQRVNAVRA